MEAAVRTEQRRQRNPIDADHPDQDSLQQRHAPHFRSSSGSKLEWRSHAVGHSAGREISSALHNSRANAAYDIAPAPGRAITTMSRGGAISVRWRRKYSRTSRRTRLRTGALPTLRLVVMPSRDGSSTRWRVITVKCSERRRLPLCCSAKYSLRLRIRNRFPKLSGRHGSATGRVKTAASVESTRSAACAPWRGAASGPGALPGSPYECEIRGGAYGVDCSAGRYVSWNPRRLLAGGILPPLWLLATRRPPRPARRRLPPLC